MKRSLARRAREGRVRTFLKRLGMALGILLVGIQLIPVDRSNPPGIRSESIYVKSSVPHPVENVLRRSCSDCHSNETRWPWYSYVAPVSWMVAEDVHEGRDQMNFSEWGALTEQKREQKLEEICEQVTNNEMPDRKYLLVHDNARVTKEEGAAICEWVEQIRQ